jgi:hypothetical protein
MENHALLGFAHRIECPYLEVIDFMSPITLVTGPLTDPILRKAAELTVRYSDAPSDLEVNVQYNAENPCIIKVQAVPAEEIHQYRI